MDRPLYLCRRYSRKIAKALTEKGYNVDIDKTITLGYLHDIGKYTGESHGHEISGYNYLKDKGYDDMYNTFIFE